MSLKLKSAVRNKTPADLLNDEVDLTISEQVILNAEVQFKKLLEIDGRFEGKLIPTANANLIITRRGHFLGDVIGLDLAFVDGKVEGDIMVRALELGPHANICGNILCQRIVIAGHAKVSGELNVSPSNVIPPPPMPQTQGLSNSINPESDIDNKNDDIHLVEDDDQACAPEFQLDEKSAEEREPVVEAVAQRRKTNALIILEPQVDLLSNSGNWPELDGEFGQQGQTEALDKLCLWIANEIDNLDDILVLLDIHYKPGLNDALFWKRPQSDESGEQDVEHPEVGTAIHISDIRDGKWIPAAEGNNVFVEEYLIDTEKEFGDDHILIIKPRHCQIGSAGAAVVDELNKVLTKWSKSHKREVNYLVSQHRGNGQSSHHSQSRGSWLYDRNQIEHIASQVDRVLLAGQVLGHCHGMHLVADIAAGIVETLGNSDDKDIAVITDALLVPGKTKDSMDDLLEEVIAASNIHQILIATTHDLDLSK